MSGANVLIYTIGHSTRPLAELLDLLRSNKVQTLIDVRRFPTSRRHPHLNRSRLDAALAAVGISYEHFSDLGGRREPFPDSPNTGWRNDSFRGYADYMSSPAFAEAVDKLAAVAENRVVAVMCAEALPWRCHRMLIADALAVQGFEVAHILGEELRQHAVTPFATVCGDTVTYPEPASGSVAEDLSGD